MSSLGMPLTSLNDYLTCHNAITQRRQHPRTTHTTRDQRLQVHTLQDVGFSLKQIQQLLPELSYDQVKYAAASERVTRIADRLTSRERILP